MKRLLYIDTFSTNSIHEVYNAATLSMFASIYDEIDYYASSSSMRKVEGILGGLPVNVRYHKIYIPRIMTKEKDLWQALWREMVALLTNIYILLFTDRRIDLIYNYNTSSATPCINVLNKFLNRKILIICHGEMAYYSGLQPCSLFFRVMRRFYINNRIVISENLYFAVLGDKILENLKDKIALPIYRHMISFDHPGIFSLRVKSIKKRYNSKLKISFVGHIRSAGSRENIFNLVKKTKDRLGNSVEFAVIGKVEKKYYSLSDIKVPEECGNYFVERSVMYDLMRQQDLIIYLYSRDAYAVTASGALLDAIECEVPVLALKNDYFSYIIGKYQFPGYLVDSVDEMEEFIENFYSLRDSVSDFSQIKEQLSAKTIAKVVKKKIENIGFLKENTETDTIN